MTKSSAPGFTTLTQKHTQIYVPAVCGIRMDGFVFPKGNFSAVQS